MGVPAGPGSPVPGQKNRRGAVMKVKDVIRLLEGEGWFLVATRGSHRQYKHPVRPGRVTVAGKPSDDLAPGTLNSILKQSGLKDQH
jgi:predicted RNA binding protein YcfA (HicA-like mRNA interferase family)